MAIFLTIFMGINLTLHDRKQLSFPLLNWLIPSLLLLIFYPLNPLAICFLLLGILAQVKDLKIGAGDFFFLASLALSLELTEVLWIIQLASWAGITTFLLKKDTSKPLPFVPYLFGAYLLVLAYSTFF